MNDKTVTDSAGAVEHPNTDNIGSVAPATAQPERWANIPTVLRERRQWCIAGPDKAPYSENGNGLYRVSVTNPMQWLDFETACAIAIRQQLHIGYVLHESDAVACIDLDVVDAETQAAKGEPIDESKWTTPQVIEGYHRAILAFDSYAERSRSGKGFHIWVEANIGAGKRKQGVEIYSQERFIICTGDVVTNKPIAARPEQLTTLLNSMMTDRPLVEPLLDTPEAESDEALLARARAASNAEKFNAHYDGNFAVIGHTDDSVADMALLQMMAHYTRNDVQLKRLFLNSVLGQREKSTKRRDYVDRTITKVRAIQATEPNASHGERIAFHIVTSALLQRLKPQCMSGSSTNTLQLISEDQMANRPPVRWRVRGVIPEEGVVAVYGPPGSGKSFLVLDLLGAISTGREWFSHKVRPAPVVYAALEGKAGVSQRVRAYRTIRGNMNGVKFIDAPLDLRRIEDRKNVIAAIIEAGWANGVLCIDTLAASAPGMDENTSTDMGAMIAALQEIQEALGGCVVVVHHTGKDQSRGLRGWSGLTGALDGAIEVLRSEDRREWKVTKAKDGEDGKTMPFTLGQVVLDLDEDGLPNTSCYVVSTESNGTSEETTKNVLALIREYYDRGEYISTAYNSPNSAFKKLESDPEFPRTLSSKALTVLLRDAERNKLIAREEYSADHRNKRERWRVL